MEGAKESANDVELGVAREAAESLKREVLLLTAQLESVRGEESALKAQITAMSTTQVKALQSKAAAEAEVELEHARLLEAQDEVSGLEATALDLRTR